MRRTFRHLMRAAVLTSVLAAAPAAEAADVDIYVRFGPPAAVVENRPAAPGTRHVWVAGYHRWQGGRYVWTAGRWTLPPHGRAVWVPGHWQHTRRGWRFVEGRWR